MDVGARLLEVCERALDLSERLDRAQLLTNTGGSGLLARGLGTLDDGTLKIRSLGEAPVLDGLDLESGAAEDRELGLMAPGERSKCCGCDASRPAADDDDRVAVDARIARSDRLGQCLESDAAAVLAQAHLQLSATFEQLCGQCGRERLHVAFSPLDVDRAHRDAGPLLGGRLREPGEAAEPGADARSAREPEVASRVLDRDEDAGAGFHTRGEAAGRFEGCPLHLDGVAGVVDRREAAEEDDAVGLLRNMAGDAGSQASVGQQTAQGVGDPASVVDDRDLLRSFEEIAGTPDAGLHLANREATDLGLGVVVGYRLGLNGRCFLWNWPFIRPPFVVGREILFTRRPPHPHPLPLGGRGIPFI